jgi:hypothetical protein
MTKIGNEARLRPTYITVHGIGLIWAHGDKLPVLTRALLDPVAWSTPRPCGGVV